MREASRCRTATGTDSYAFFFLQLAINQPVADERRTEAPTLNHSSGYMNSSTSVPPPAVRSCKPATSVPPFPSSVPPAVRPCRPATDVPAHPDILALIEYYNQNHSRGLIDRLESLKNTTDFVCGLHNSTPGPKDHYRRNSHQFCIPTKVISAMIETLSGLNPRDFADFEQLRDCVIDLRTSHDISNYADLCVYDFSLHFGYHHSILPDRRVYIHAGAAKGAKALRRLGLITGEITPPSIPIEAFDPSLREMGAMHLENFMCIVHRQLTQMADTLQSPSAKKTAKSAVK